MPLTTMSEVIDFLKTAAADLEIAEFERASIADAERIRRDIERLAPVTRDQSEAETLAKIREVVGPGKYVSLDKRITDNGLGSITAEFTIWDGKTHHKGNTRQAALNVLIAAHTPPSDQPFDPDPPEANAPSPPPTPEQVDAYKPSIPF